MDRVAELEQVVQKLSAEELAKFRAWFAAFDADAWDRQMEDDIAAGKLDGLADRALRDHAAGKSTRL